MKSGQLALASVILLMVMLNNYHSPIGITTTFSDVVPSSVLTTDHGCTSFCLDNAGHGVFGTNLDELFYEGYLYVNQRHVSKTGWEQNAAGEYARWTSKYGSLTFNLVGYQLPWAGMNEAGLMISTMYLPETRVPDADERPSLTSPFWLQYQLDNYSSVEEVIGNESLVRISPGARDHYLVCDASGDCATIELLDGKMVYHAGETLPVAALTNHIYAESFKAWQTGPLPDSYYNSLRRFGTAADRVMSFEPMRSGDAVEYAFETLIQVRNPDLTAWSIVFDAQNLRAYFRTVLNEEIRYIDFSKLDFACGRPVQMLNIHEKLSGDVSDDLMPYSHGVSFGHLRKAFPYFGIHIPEEWMEKLLEQIENYPCVKAEAAATQEAPLVRAEAAITQEAPLVKAGAAITQEAPLVKAEAESTQEAPQGFFFMGWLVAAALLALVLLLIRYGIHRKKIMRRAG